MEIIKSAVLIEQIESSNSRRFRFICECGEKFIADSRQIKRNKKLRCRKCLKKLNRELIKEARKRKRKWEAPEFRFCKSCLETKPYKDFREKRHICKKCHNVGRSAYYHYSMEGN